MRSFLPLCLLGARRDDVGLGQLGPPSVRGGPAPEAIKEEALPSMCAISAGGVLTYAA
jgi:hypothetical protein